MLRPLALPALALLMLAGCSREGPEDPAMASPGAGIPMGAVGAVGASFDAPTATPVLGSPRKPKPGKHHGVPAPEVVPDPFESPPDDPSPPPSPKPPKKGQPKPHSPSETTL